MQKPSVTVHRTIEFSETDAAGLVHFSNYFRFMETAERVFFEQAEVPLIHNDPAAPRGFPRVDASCRYSHPLRFGDVVAITLTLEKVRSCALHFTFSFKRRTCEHTFEPVAEGTMTTVYIAADPKTGKMQAQQIPEAWLAKMGWHTPPEPLSDAAFDCS